MALNHKYESPALIVKGANFGYNSNKTDNGTCAWLLVLEVLKTVEKLL